MTDNGHTKASGSQPVHVGTAFSGLIIQDEATLCANACGLELNRVRELEGFARERRESLVHVLVERGGVNERHLLEGIAEALGLDFIGEPQRISADVLAAVPASLAIRHHAMPVGQGIGGRIRMACSVPFGWQDGDELSQILKRPLEKVLCPQSVIERMLTENYGLGADTVERLVADRVDEEVRVVGAGNTDLSEEQAANEPTVVNLVNRILTEAIRAGATDIHFEPYDSKYRVRYRIDGILEDVSIPVSVKLLKLALVSRIKIMADLDITEKRVPQDGRAQVTLAGQGYDLRISILPGVYGEAVNIRLQNRQMVQFDLERLGFAASERAKIEHLIQQPHGLVLVTGPTGSGKTTTLYTCLSQINKPGTKIITVEDPVEYWMEDILQLQVYEEVGFSFARALRSMLRHDPDVMLVGEIRDRETADIAIRASLTGHQVFATLHTNDAASAITRLIDIGVEPFLVASSVSGIIAQRLVRKICPACKRETSIETLPGVQALWEGEGCDKCRFTGYRGRSAVAETLLVSPELREMIQQRATADRIKEIAVREGMNTLRERAIDAVKSGQTTSAEMLRVTLEDY